MQCERVQVESGYWADCQLTPDFVKALQGSAGHCFKYYY